MEHHVLTVVCVAHIADNAVPAQDNGSHGPGFPQANRGILHRSIRLMVAGQIGRWIDQDGLRNIEIRIGSVQ